MTNQVTVLTDLTAGDWHERKYDAIKNVAMELHKLNAAPKQLRIIHEVNRHYWIGRLQQAREVEAAIEQQCRPLDIEYGEAA